MSVDTHLIAAVHPSVSGQRGGMASDHRQELTVDHVLIQFPESKLMKKHPEPSHCPKEENKDFHTPDAVRRMVYSDGTVPLPLLPLLLATSR